MATHSTVFAYAYPHDCLLSGTSAPRVLALAANKATEHRTKVSRLHNCKPLAKALWFLMVALGLLARTLLGCHLVSSIRIYVQVFLPTAMYLLGMANPICELGVANPICELGLANPICELGLAKPSSWHA